MSQTLQYIVDNSGNKVSVIVPVTDWEKLNNQYQKLLNKLDVLQGIKDSINEIKASKKNAKELQSLSDFLNED
jgi:hypothetical protein